MQGNSWDISSLFSRALTPYANMLFLWYFDACTVGGVM